MLTLTNKQLLRKRQEMIRYESTYTNPILADVLVRSLPSFHEDDQGTQPMLTQQFNSPQQNPASPESILSLPEIPLQPVTFPPTMHPEPVTLPSTMPCQPATLPSTMPCQPVTLSSTMPCQPVTLLSTMPCQPVTLLSTMPCQSATLPSTMLSGPMTFPYTTLPQPASTQPFRYCQAAMAPSATPALITNGHNDAPVRREAPHYMVDDCHPLQMDGACDAPWSDPYASLGHGAEGLEGVRMDLGVNHVDLYCQCSHFNTSDCPLTRPYEIGIPAGNVTAADVGQHDPARADRSAAVSGQRRPSAATATVTSGALDGWPLPADGGYPRPTVVADAAADGDRSIPEARQPRAATTSVWSIDDGYGNEVMVPEVDAFRPVEHYCNLCTKMFRNAYTLDQHIEPCIDRHPHECMYCGRGFKSAYQLKCHIRTHTGVRPFKCKECQKTFIQRSTLNKHIAVKHGASGPKKRSPRVYVCEECGHIEVEYDDLISHQKEKHPSCPDTNLH